MRRGEVVGLRWSEIDLDGARLTAWQTISMVGDRPEVGTPKTAAGRRVIALDAGTVTALRGWRKDQAEERLVMGAGWQWADHGLITSEPDGRMVHPQVRSRRFRACAKSADLPAIRLHDVRHSCATAAPASGVPVMVLSQRLRHADIAVTLRVYAHVISGDHEAGAESIAAFIEG